MEAGSKDHPPMLAPDWKDKEVPISKGSPITRTERVHETYKNVSQKIRDQLNAEAEAVQIILTGIDNDIYLTVDACPNALNEIRAEKIACVLLNNNQSIILKIILITTLRIPQLDHNKLLPETEENQLSTLHNPSMIKKPSMVAEDDETSQDKEIDKVMALISLSFKKFYKPTNNNLRTSSNTSRANKDNSPRINKSVGYENQRIGNVARARETKPKRSKDAAYHREKMLLCKQDEARIQLNAKQADWRDDTNDDELEDQDLEAHYMYMAQLQEVSLDAADSGPIFDDEPLQKVSNDDHYNVFAMESGHPGQSKFAHHTYPTDQDAHNMIIDSLDISYDREEIDQNDDDTDLAKERELLASLIEKLKCEIGESKNHNKFLETSNKVLIEKLKGEIEDFKNKNKSLESSNNYFKEANNRLSETTNLLYTDYKNSEAELSRQMKEKLSAHQETISILSQQKEAQIKLYKTREDKELDKVIELEQKVKVLDNIVYKTGQSVQTINMLNNKCQTSFAKHEFLKKAQRENPRLYDIGCYNDNLALMLAPDSDKVIFLEKESRSKLSDLIRPFDYDKLNNIYDLFVLQREKSSEQRYFSERSRLSHTHDNNEKSKEPFNKKSTLLEKRMDESIPLDKKCQSSIENFKVKTYVNTIINGVELCKEKIANRTYIGYIDPFIKNMIESNFSPVISRINVGLDQFHRCLNEEMVADLRYFNSLELEDLKAQLQDKGIVISELKKLIEKLKRKYVDTKFKKSSVIRQPKALKSQRPSVLGKPTTFSNSFVRNDFSKSKSVTQTNVSNNFSKPVTAQTLPPNKKSILKNTNVLSPGMYKLHIDHNQARTSQLPQDSRKTNKRVLFSKGVIPTTSVSRPQLKSNPMGDRVMRNNSQEKKQEVEDQSRNVKFPKNKTSVTACNDSLNAKTLNVNSISAIKTCSWWYSKFTPSGYKWKPKSGKENVNPNLVEIVLFIVDPGCSKHMRGNLKLLINFVENFLGTVKFRNDQIVPILGYGDLVQGAVTINRVYYVEGLNHNLFFVGQFCDPDLEVTFRKSTCYIRDLNENDLLTGSCGTELYSITLQDTNCPNPICLMAKASSSQTWLWHRRLSHLNFDTINLLSKNDIVVGL
uniref:Integrase, catalytic region, zinc finger, CCHC-type, peptidase aspartic, catalytic n=1 Tax=Tanacetum cinerariifolium TaxID=118510 RepID=A0A6L2KLN7_TANCI|nr:integrase, catalytic region, zinc finger, CCHC-type, peptidase aspartic, catalytic [Tanacetum cinerariifolium]